MPNLRAPDGGRLPLVRSALVVAAAALALLAGSASGAQNYEPPDGSVISGAAVDWPPQEELNAFAARTGQPSLAMIHVYSSALGSLSGTLQPMRDVDAAVMISWRMMDDTPSAPGGTLQSVVNGAVDDYLARSAAAVAGHPRPVFLRPMWEMSGDWFEWSAYDGDTPRAGNSPELYRAAWNRAWAIFQGGTRAEVDARLRGFGQTGFKGSQTRLTPARQAAWVWSAAKGPAKPFGRVRTADYYPGDEAVDWVATSFHQWENLPVSFWTSQIDNGFDPLARLDDLYRFAVAHGKPLMLSEWGVSTKPYGNGDDPSWIDDTFAWIKAHPKAKAQVYFERVHGANDHRLAVHARSRAAFARGVDSVASIHKWRNIPIGGTAPVASPAPGPTDGTGVTGTSSGAVAELQTRTPGTAAPGSATVAGQASGPGGSSSPDKGAQACPARDLPLLAAGRTTTRLRLGRCARGAAVTLTVTTGPRRVTGEIRAARAVHRFRVRVAGTRVAVRRVAPRTWTFTAPRPRRTAMLRVTQLQGHHASLSLPVPGREVVRP